MHCERGRQLALDVEANLVALRLKKQLGAYRENRETILGCHVVAGILAFLIVGSFATAKPLAATSIFVVYAIVGLIILPVCSRRNMRAWETMAVPLSVLWAAEDCDILDERTLRSREPKPTDAALRPVQDRLTRHRCKSDVDELGGWLAARGLYVRLPVADGASPGFLQTSLGARVRRRLEVSDFSPGDPFGPPCAETAAR